MKSNNLDKIFSTIIYVLTIFLIGLILYNIFLILNKNLISKSPSNNSVKVSPISEESIYVIPNMNSIHNVTFKDTNFDRMTSLSKAIILYENDNDSKQSTIYSALFSDKNFTKDLSSYPISTNIDTQLMINLN
ncbi:hypothetical protein [Clostridium uliginosum]|uniref:Uncharacterized protein n=1 Tax=Clostridium uliginosum TaxID=119641 RepID=A0A1I1MIE1_9CLOT|nr:hypothetical protein [Clostridium uliginosum]SFC82443.1 hypothetical protein SAMN05421842_11088 [Clostridium uliginosum]